MSDYVFDIPAFRLAYPEFANSTVYPDALLNRTWTSATCFISTCQYGRLTGDCRYLAITLMVAHLLKLGELIAAGLVPNMPQNASIDMVSVGLTPPPVLSELAWWLNLTGYGGELYVLLQMKAAGGFYITGFANITIRYVL